MLFIFGPSKVKITRRSSSNHIFLTLSLPLPSESCSWCKFLRRLSGEVYKSSYKMSEDINTRPARRFCKGGRPKWKKHYQRQYTVHVFNKARDKQKPDKAINCKEGIGSTKRTIEQTGATQRKFSHNQSIILVLCQPPGKQENSRSTWCR